MINDVYSQLVSRIDTIRQHIQQPLTYAEKILYAHTFDISDTTCYKRGEAYINLKPDRVAMQDATAQMALLQFILTGKNTVSIPSSVHCDHLIKACCNAQTDLNTALHDNKEIYDFLASVCQKYGIDFWKPGAGIIHQIVLENYAFPGGMMIGTDSHTPNAGGLAMGAIGVGGADAVDVMVGIPWELKFPKVMGIKLIGQLSGWASAKDIILHLTGILSVKGATGYILEYFGKGTATLSATGKATICNMGTEVGATTSLFPFDESIAAFLAATHRKDIADAARNNAAYLRADDAVYAYPEKHYDTILEINLSDITPYINGPFTPDRAWALGSLKDAVKENDFPERIAVGLIGSCTNSSYEDLSRIASLAQQANIKNIPLNAELLITPGSSLVNDTAARDGLLALLEKNGAQIMANACGPCIGQWNRTTDDPEQKNTIVHSYNRNFRKRADGNPNTYAFVASPDMVMALTLAGRLDFNPITDPLTDRDGNAVMLEPPVGDILPQNGFIASADNCILPNNNNNDYAITVSPHSERLQLLTPFPAWDGSNIHDAVLLIKIKGKCTTDHISPAGPWLKYRGHLDAISNNLLIGAENSFNGKTNTIKNRLSGSYDSVPAVARAYKKEGLHSVIIGDENYGEGSSREHAAMEPRHLGVAVVIAKSFARIHETNLKKQGVLALTFKNPEEYNSILEDDTFSFALQNFNPDNPVTMTVYHADGSKNTMILHHTYSAIQIAWFKAGSALNYIRTITE